MICRNDQAKLRPEKENTHTTVCADPNRVFIHVVVYEVQQPKLIQRTSDRTRDHHIAAPAYSCSPVCGGSVKVCRELVKYSTNTFREALK